MSTARVLACPILAMRSPMDVSALAASVLPVCVCAEQKTNERLDRWLVEGYWYIADSVPSHTSHPNFPGPEPPQHYEAAIERLHDLQNWFVTGRSPYLATCTWPDL
ncbi:hypothetical protein GCM10022224_080630 [Nonomuraea antimicrobica]|uniref:Uncharacterized protein n=1 Tax=Nonomuraea antimicrobica TaxID=561173 RepID=A0ABP7DD37_9ACTN